MVAFNLTMLNALRHGELCTAGAPDAGTLIAWQSGIIEFSGGNNLGNAPD
jgi:hypothetical protein